jgi:hypothetical protein
MFELKMENSGQFGHSVYERERERITKIPLFLYFTKSGFASVNTVESDRFNSSTVPKGAEISDPRWLH